MDLKELELNLLLDPEKKYLVFLLQNTYILQTRVL